MKPVQIHAILIAYNNPDQTELRWKRDVLPGLKNFDHSVAATCVDNSTERSDRLADLFGVGYLWQGGENLQYGPSINLAVGRVPSAFTLYACTRHGRMIDPGWVADLIDPMIKDARVGVTGFLMGSNSPEGVAAVGPAGVDCSWVKERFRFADGVPQHVQGGVFACRTEVLIRCPYPPEYPHLYTDHMLTWQALKAGYLCRNVPSVVSLYRQDPDPTKLAGVKYVHGAT